MSELDELKKDKARLDWLADVNNQIGTVMLPTAVVENNVGSLRDAIDTAMELDALEERLVE